MKDDRYWSALAEEIIYMSGAVSSVVEESPEQDKVTIELSPYYFFHGKTWTTPLLIAEVLKRATMNVESKEESSND